MGHHTEDGPVGHHTEDGPAGHHTEDGPAGHHVQTIYFVGSMWKDHLNIGMTI